jgi:flagellar hook-associated protein 2
VEEVVPGATLTLGRKAPDTTVSVGVSKTSDATRSLVERFAEAYNDLVSFLKQQGTASGGIGRDPLSRGLRNELRSTLTGQYVAGGAWSSLARVGVEFDRTGTLTVDADRLTAALSSDEAGVRRLFLGDGTNPGVVSAIGGTIDRYADAGALIADTQDRINAQVQSLDRRLAALEIRLADRRALLQKEFSVADTLMAQLNSQSGSLQNLGSQYQLF